MCKRNQAIHQAVEIVFNHNNGMIDKSSIESLMSEYQPFSGRVNAYDFVDFYCDNAANDSVYEIDEAA
jgi:hypothetical protein